MEGVLKYRDTPMDYDDNEFSIHNVDLTEEGSSTVSPVLRPYDFDDGGHLSFDSLVENEVFLGITGQEDNQWIEEYSRGTSSSVVESRRDNVWSEAASSESVEMLLKSVGQGTLVTVSSDEPTNMDRNLKQDEESNHAQEAMVTDKEDEGALATEEPDVIDEPCSVSINPDPNLKQEDENNHTQEAIVTNEEEDGALVTEQLDVGDDMDPNLKQDDGNGHAHEARVMSKEVGALVNEEIDASDDPCDLDTDVDRDLKQDDGNNHAHEAMILNKPQDQEEAKVSGGDLDSDVIGNKCDLSEEKDDGICDDVNHEARDIVVELSENNLQEHSTSKIECGNLDASNECNLKKCSSSNERDCSTENMDDSIGSQTAHENCTTNDENCTNNDENCTNSDLLMTEACAEVSRDSKCAVTAFSAEPELNNDLMHEDSPAVAVKDDDKTKSENPAYVKSNVVLDLQSRYVEESEKPDSVCDPSELFCEGNSVNDVGIDMTNTWSSPKVITENTDLVASPKVHSENSNKDHNPAAKLSGSVAQEVNDEIQSSEQDGGMCIDCNSTFYGEGNASLPLDIDIAALDSQQNVESVLSPEGCKTQGSEVDITILAEPVAAVKSDMVSSSDTKDRVHLHSENVASSVHHYNEEKKEEGFVGDGTCEYESLKAVGSMVACASLSSVETGASPDRAGDGVLETSVENMNANMNDLAQETVDPVPCDSSAKVCDNVEAGAGMQESISGHHVDMSIEQHASTDVGLTSEYDDSHTRHEKDGSVSMDKIESVSPLINTNDDELSQSTIVEPSEGAISENTSLPEVTEDMVLTAECNDSSVYIDKLQSVSSVLNATGEGALNENTPLPEATEDVALTSECNDSQMRHDEDSSVSMDKLQSVSPLSDTNNTELSENTRVTSSEGAIDENTTLPEATEDVVLTSECDDGHMRHEEDGSVSEDKLQSVSLLLNANDTELSRSTGKTHNAGGINENTSLPKAAEDVALTSECNYGHTDKLQSVSPLLNTNSTELSPNTSVKSSDSAVNENTPLPDATDNVLTTECDSHMRNEEDSSVSPLLYTNNTEPSQSARVEPNDVAINENNSLPVPDVVLTSEGDDSHKEDSSVSMDKLQSVSPLLNTNNTEPSQSTRVNSGDGAIIENTALPEAEDVVRISECDDSHVRHEEGKLQSVSPLLDTNNTELSQNTRVGPSEGAINETASLPEATEDVQGKEQSISSNSDMKTDNSFTFEVSGTAGLTETCKGLQLFPASQSSNLSTTTEVPCIDSNKPNEAPAVTLQTPGSGTVITGGKERKTRRKSVGKESATKSKETPTIRQGRVKKSSPLTVTTPQSPAAVAAGHAIQFQELGSKEKSSPLPDLNNATCIFHQPFTDNQQVQLRAQILVYGSLISGMPPEEPHMIAAFGQSDAERKTWKDAWHACLNRDNGQKSHANTPRSDLKDLGHRTPDLGIKHSSPPPAVSPLIPVPSPLWNMSTPSSVGFPSRSAAFQQPFAPIHPPTYHTPPNPLWLSQSPFFGQWGVASSPASTAARFSGLPITEAVKLTPVKFSGCGPHTYSVPVVHSALFSSQSTDGKNASGESKSRKRKKVTADVSTVMTPSAHPHIPFLVENQTDSVTTPVVTSIFSSSVTVSTPPASKSNRKVEEANVQEADVNATKTRQPSSTSRSTKRTKVTTSASVNQTPVSTQASEISLLAQNRTISVPAPAFCTPFPTSVAMSTPGYRNVENALAVEETLSKVKESKLQAENAALLAAAEVSNCQDVWSGLDSENNSGVVSDAEAKLMSSLSAATTVAKMASAAAKIASNVAEQAKLMADEVFQSGKSETFSHVSHPSVVNKATPASILKSVDKSHETTDSHPNSIISAAREAARRRIEAASAASKHAENLDAIVKAAELAAEAVSQVGKIVAMSDSSALRKLAEAGPEGFWKISPLAYEQHQGGKTNIPDVFNEEDTKAVGVSTATNTRSPHTYAGHRIPQHISGIWEEHNIKEGCLVEVYKENGKCKGAWLAANVLSLKDEKALVCYTNIQSSDEGSENAKEWVAFEVEGSEEVPGIRIAHPMTTMRFEGSRKRRRTAVTDYAWSKGDRVDVWMQDCWREGIVVEPNKIDVTFLTVQFPAQGETSIVRSWHVRPTLIWKDRKWIEWNGGRASQGEAPKEKRMKLGSPAVNDTRKDKLPMIAEVGMHEEKGTLLPILSAKESCFNVGKSTDKPSGNLRTIQKDKARVVFGVPKPGKKQKFMAVSTQYVDGRSDKSNKNNTTNGSLKFSKPPGARGSKNDAMENQAIETKSRLLKSRKPPVPSFRTTTSRDSELSDADSVENASSRQNQTQVGSSSNKRRDPAKGPLPKKAFTFTSKPKSEQFNRGKLQVAPKVEVKNTSISQVNEPRRSNRKIQPTSRLLEGLQSSLTISKIPSVSHAVRRNFTTKGSTSHGTS